MQVLAQGWLRAVTTPAFCWSSLKATVTLFPAGHSPEERTQWLETAVSFMFSPPLNGAPLFKCSSKKLLEETAIQTQHCLLWCTSFLAVRRGKQPPCTSKGVLWATHICKTTRQLPPCYIRPCNTLSDPDAGDNQGTVCLVSDHQLLIHKIAHTAALKGSVPCVGALLFWWRRHNPSSRTSQCLPACHNLPLLFVFNVSGLCVV